MDFSDVTRLYKDDLSKVEECIRTNYDSDIPLIPGISAYLMNGGGKRIRPLLLLIANRLCGSKTDEKVIRHGCVVEFIHAATLLHDDVVDETTVRRGHETVNSKWGSDASILVGDFLISRGILILAEYCEAPVIRAISEATKILVEGGMLEYTWARDLSVSEEHCIDVIYRKTSSIMIASCQIGALLANAEKGQEKALVDFGRHFGMGFQLVDDAMDYDADEELLGKPPGNDFREGHVTLPLLHLYLNSGPTVKREIQGFVENEHLGQREFDYILERLREAKSIEYTLDLARDHMDRAKKVLRETRFPCPEYRDHLIAAADYVVDRMVPAKPCS